MRPQDAGSARELLENHQWNQRERKEFRYEILCSYILEHRSDLLKYDKRFNELEPSFSLNDEEQILLADKYYAFIQEFASTDSAPEAVRTALRELDQSSSVVQGAVYYSEINKMSYFEFHRAILSNDSSRYWPLISLALLANRYSYVLVHRHRRLSERQDDLFNDRGTEISRRSTEISWESVELVEQAMALSIYDRDLIRRYRELMNPLIDLYSVHGSEHDEDFRELRATVIESLDEIEVLYELNTQE